MAGVGVNEASEAYERAMRNIATGGPSICPICRTFVDPGKGERCYPCAVQPDNLSAVVPITYSENLGQVHTALRNYKDGGSRAMRRQAAVRLAAILWRFLREHESCVSDAAGVAEFDLATIVPSSDPQRDEHSPFRELTGWIEPTKGRMERLLEPTGETTKEREFSAGLFRPRRRLSREAVLLLDDTWTTGSSARSAAHALRQAGASSVALVVIGRHVNPKYEPVDGSGTTCGDLLEALPEDFDWNTCAVHP